MNKNLSLHAEKFNNLVTIDHGRPTTSLKIAETFGKRHDNVTQSIVRLDCSPEFTRLNFQASDYTDPTGRTLPMYLVTRDGFTFLAMGFRGKKAAAFKERYISEFNRMEHLLNQRHDSAWIEARNLGKQARRAETDAINELVRYAEAKGSRNARWYFKNLTNLAYRALGFEHGPRPIRDMLNPQQQAALTLIESATGEIIRAGIMAGEHYRDIYGAVKTRAYELATVLTPVSRLAA